MRGSPASAKLPLARRLHPPPAGSHEDDLTAPTHLARSLRLLVVAVLLAAGAAATATAPAFAAKTSVCGKKVIDDWYDNGRVDGTYPPRCYDEAIDALPRDVRDYSSAKEDITRALQARLRGEEAPPATTDPTPGDGDSVDVDGDGVPDDPPTGAPDDGDADGDDPGGGNSGPGGGGDPDGVPEATGGDVDTAASDSLPLPLLVLAGLALLLVAAGTLGYVARRLQARRLGAPPAP